VVIPGDRKKTIRKKNKKAWGGLYLSLNFQVTDLHVQGIYSRDRDTTLQRKQDSEKTLSFQV
jgi:hypothetical protein